MGGHYFDENPDVDDRRRDISVRLGGRELRVTTSSGTFSPDHLDKATEVLLEQAPLPDRPGTYVDLGCGWGPIAIALALAAPNSEVWAVDVNARARELTRLNAERATAAVRVVEPEDVPADVRFDEIWSNPPIRVGKDALHELLLTWLPRLAPTGAAYLVVGKNLGADSLHAWLTAEGWPTERIASSRGFRVLRVTSGECIDV